MRPGVDYTAADQDALRSYCQQQRLCQLTEHVGDRLPDRAVSTQICRGVPNACLNGGAGDQTLDTIAVEPAVARPKVAWEASNPHVTQFGMMTTQYRFTGRDQADTDAGSDRNVSRYFLE